MKKNRDLLQEATVAMQAAGFDQPALEARQLIIGALKVSATEWIGQQDQVIDDDAVLKINKWLQQRLEGVPLAYLIGKKGFYKSEFYVEAGILVPRPESEMIVEIALRRIRDRGLVVQNLADLGCGSGCLGLSLLVELPPSAYLWAVDCSPTAIRLTKKNAQALALENRVRVVSSAVEQWQPSHRFELVVANPPYIAEGDKSVQPSVHDHEPHLALYAGKDGLECIRKWSAHAAQLLIPGGVFVCEFGASQAMAVRDIMNELKFENIQVSQDLQGLDRIVSAHK